MTTLHWNEQRRRFGWGAALGLLALAAWLLRPTAAAPEPVSPFAPALRSPAEHAPIAAHVTPIDYSPDGVPIHPADNRDMDTVGMQPHPITPTHERIFRENNLIGELNGAMDVKDVAGLRALLAQYRDEYPEDAHALQSGYELIANCQERLTPERRAAAQRYYDEQLDSGLRRYIRRYCLEAPVL